MCATEHQPIAKKLAERLPFLKEFEESYESAVEAAETWEVAEIQYEFNQQVADILFAHGEVEQDLEVSKVLTEQQVTNTYPLAELDRARDRFVENLRRLKEGEDPTPHIENFLPAILPALRIGIRLIGRKRVVNFLAGLLGKLIRKFVGPQYTRPLSQAIVDAGLRLLRLEATPEEESRAAAEAVAATVEETVRRVAAAPDYVLDNQELLEGFALEAFEQAAAANLPPVLPEATYRKRPDLAVARKLRGVWVMMPRGRWKRYKKFSRRIPVRLTPHKVTALETFEGIPVEEFLEDQLGVEPGEEVEAFVHLYEAIPGTHLSDIVRQEENIAKVDTANGYVQLHPLTRDAATLLLGEPELGRDADPRSISNPHAPLVGQRFYYLEIPGKRPLTIPGPADRTKGRRPTRVRLILDFPKNEIRVYLFLSEIRAQEIAVKLRQHAHIGMVTAQLRRFIERGLRAALKGAFGRLKIIHEAVTPDQWLGALWRLPSLVPQVLLGRLTQWVVKGLSDHLKQRTEEFIKAAEDTADGVTLVITLGDPPGFPQLRQALKGKGLSLANLKLADGAPTVKIKITPGISMNDSLVAIKMQIARQVAHWTKAAARLQNLDDLASPSAWNSLERYLGLSIRRHLSEVVAQLDREATLLQAAFDAAISVADLSAVRRQLLAFRKRYMRVETTLDFYADAINTRTNLKIAGYLRACDTLAYRSMTQLFDLLGKPTPVVLTYIDKGLGASILKAGLRLWDGTSMNPVAAIKITRHNLLRPTALIHEAGHQVAHIAGWNEELASALGAGLADAPAGVAEAWAGWASEIAADAFAFAHTGYASVAALHDVLAGEEALVFRHTPGDPHPISYIRVLLGVEMCRQFYGYGLWDDLALSWTQLYPLERAPGATQSLLRASLPLLPRIVEVTLRKPMRAFGGRPLVALINPERVKPETLLAMEQQLGPALYTSMHWIWTEALRLLALTGMRAATMIEQKKEMLKQQEEWMLRLGGALQAA